MEPIQAGGVDWEANWRQIVEERRLAIEVLAGLGPQRDYWERRADRFVRMVRDFDAAADPLTQMLQAALDSGGTLLDVGAGAGRHTLALADAASRVTAVEPSAAMRAALESELARRGLANVTIVAGAWEEAAVEPHDVVLASHVLYPIADVVPFVRKLDAASRRACYITLRVDDMVPQITPLWRAVWGRERPREPGFLDLYNLLFAIGIRPNVRLVPFGSGLGFDTLDEAVEYARRMLFVPVDEHAHDARIGAFLETVLVSQTGRLMVPNIAQSAILWWDKDEPLERPAELPAAANER